MSFVTIPGLVKAESTDTTAETAEVQIPSAEVPEGATVHDVVIVGSGPAGYTAAVYTARAGLAPIVLAGQLAAGGALMNTTEVENFPGFPEGIQGPELMDNMREQAEKFGADIRYEDVVAVNLEGDVKAVATEDEVFYARAVILATGSEYRHMNVPGEDEFSGRGVSYCATCDGFFFKDRRLAVIGGGDSAMEEATFLTNFASEVVVVHRRDALRASRVMAERALNNPKISFEWNATVEEVLGDEAVTGLRLASTVDGSTREIAVDGVFVAIGHLPRTGFLRGQVALDEAGYITVDEPSTRTSVAGVFACGDAVDHTYRQAITAAGLGLPRGPGRGALAGLPGRPGVTSSPTAPGAASAGAPRPRTCPCGSGAMLAQCCGRYLDGEAAPTAEALMRSRYTAFALRDEDYLFRTWHPRTRPAPPYWVEGTQWTGLQILGAEAGGPSDEEGTVTFVASWRDASTGETGQMREHSRFSRRAGRWVYEYGAND